MDKLGNSIIAILLGGVSAAVVTSVFNWARDSDLADKEKKEKLYAPLRLYLSTLRSIDKHFDKIAQAGDEADKEILKILTFPLCCFDQISCFFPKRTT
jgi:hypothetical protein